MDRVDKPRSDAMLLAGRRGVVHELGCQALRWKGAKALQQWELRGLKTGTGSSELSEWCERSTRRARHFQGVTSFLIGLGFGVIGVLYVSQWRQPDGTPPPTTKNNDVARVVGSESTVKTCRELRHLVKQGEAWQDIAELYGVSAEELKRANGSSEIKPPAGSTLEVCSYGLAGSEVGSADARVPAPVEVPEGEEPSLSVGAPNRGELRNAVQLPNTRYYDLRCPATAYSTKEVADRLQQSLAALRGKYRGQIVVADISRKSGGTLLPHASHQSGRDADIWLPIVGGQYHKRDGCGHCGTPWCKPNLDEIDWEATWFLLESLVIPEVSDTVDPKPRPSVEVSEIFLEISDTAEAALHATALAHSSQERYTVVMKKVTNNDRHRRHMHVRFTCPANDPACIVRSVQ